MWEYSVVNIAANYSDGNERGARAIDAVLNRKGAEGWELVSITPGIGPEQGCSYYIFKRSPSKESAKARVII